jgi:hypothetical protein
MGRLNNTDSVWRAAGALGALMLTASAGLAGPMHSDRPARLPPTETSVGAFRSNAPVASERTRSFTAEAVREARVSDIPWTLDPLSTIHLPIAAPDWRMMPSRVIAGPDGRASVRRARVLPALAALRGDAPSPAGSVFSSIYGEEPATPAEPSLSSKHVDDEGNPVFAAPTKYFQDFEDGTVAREWHLAGVDDMEKFGRFAGPYRNSTQTLYVQCEPDTPYVVTFDLLFIAAQLGDPEASDLFSVEVDGQPLLQDTFLALRARNEAFNKDREGFDADIYKQVAVTFTPTGDGVVKIKFKSAAHGSPGGETWGLDNVHIDIAPKQTLGELNHSDPSDAGVLGSIAGLSSAGYNGPFDAGKSYFQGDPSIRPPGPSGPTIPPQVPVPSPGAGALLVAGGWAALRRRR